MPTKYNGSFLLNNLNARTILVRECSVLVRDDLREAK